MYSTCLCALAFASFSCAAFAAQTPRSLALDHLIARYARINAIPESLVRRVVVKESNFEPTAFNGRYYGLMQITYRTACSMGYRGDPKGLLNPEVNLTYAVPYLANAYRLAGGNAARAIRLYSTGYYSVAKRRKLLDGTR
ncbi:MAG: lytic transglycosylase domain-containing protein [Methylovirgula sp.]